MPDKQFQVTEAIGRRCRAELTIRGIKQMQVADLAGVGDSAVSQFLSGRKASEPVYKAILRLMPDWAEAHLPTGKEVYQSDSAVQEDSVVPGATAKGCGNAD